MAKRNVKLKRQEEKMDSFHDGIFDSFKDIAPGNRDIIPVKTPRNFNIDDLLKGVGQRLAYAVYEQHDIIFLLGPAGTGKALTLDSHLYTKDGPMRMGDVKTGDEVANPDGGFSKVTGVYPQGKKIVNRVYFSDYTYVDCCEDHLWTISHCDNGWTRTVNTKYLVENCRRPKDGKRVLSIECAKPVGFTRKEYIIPPYVMGILLAEGNLTNSNVCFASCESEIYDTVKSQIDSDYVCNNTDSNYRIVKETRSSKSNKYKDEVKRLGLWGKYAWEKHIPQEYLYGSVDQRVSLLQALMDGDGYICKKSSISYNTTSYQLAKDFCQLVYSLGGATRIAPKEGAIKEDGTRHRVSYNCHVNLPMDVAIFLMSRKTRRRKARTKYLPKRYIDRVEQLGEQEMQCITVDHDRHLYLTDNFTVTHNSHISCLFALNDFIKGSKSRIILTRPIIEAGEKLGFLPGPQPLDAKISTPHGWKEMGEIKVGDFVIGRDGKPTKVIGVFPKGEREVYKVETSENTFTECCADHLWFTKTAEDKKRNRSGSVKSTKDIVNTLYNKKGKINHFLPRNEAVEYSKKNIPLDSYTLGVLLGDGNLGNSISFASIDDEMANRVSSAVVSLNCHLSKNKKISYYVVQNKVKRRIAKKLVLSNSTSVREYSSCEEASCDLGVKVELLRERCRNRSTINGFKYSFMDGENKFSHPLKNIIENLGLLQKKSYEKFIPDIYKYSSIPDRIDLLRGLMDTDGTVKENGEASYTTTSKRLALDVIELIRSLGGRARMPKGRLRIKNSVNKNGRIIRSRRISYEFTVSMPKDINPFYISRKFDRFKMHYMYQVGIKSVEFVGKKDVQCILIENDEHLYLTDDFIVTHNTFAEKTDPYMIPLYDCIRKVIPKGPLAEEIQSNTEVAPLAFMRGRTFQDSICILDEAQNCTWGQLVLFLTRLGDNSKMIITGDPTQSDIGRDSALMDVVHRLEGVDGIGMVKFTEEHIVRHRLVGEIIKRLRDR